MHRQAQNDVLGVIRLSCGLIALAAIDILASKVFESDAPLTLRYHLSGGVRAPLYSYNVAACNSRAKNRSIIHGFATPRRHLPHVTASYTLTPQGKMRIGKRNNAVLRKYYDVVAMEKQVVALRPKPLAASANASWEADLAAARRDPC